MPIEPGATENEQEFISRCMSEETQTYPQDQSYAICKSKWDTKMSKMSSMQRVILTINNNKNDALIPKGKV
tara:strand:- start:119 stop:331 length:213 start_codon:yes stop_codon:yes gene_type:complete